MFENIAKDAGLATEQDAAKNIQVIESKTQADVQADLTQVLGAVHTEIQSVLVAIKPLTVLASTVQDALAHGKLIISIEIGKK